MTVTTEFTEDKIITAIKDKMISDYPFINREDMVVRLQITESSVKAYIAWADNIHRDERGCGDWYEDLPYGC